LVEPKSNPHYREKGDPKCAIKFLGRPGAFPHSLEEAQEETQGNGSHEAQNQVKHNARGNQARAADDFGITEPPVPAGFQYSPD
tara:strand:- start:154 stop:405 length:252 start_codon:yes stop_codon:yes gene_type:complete